MAHIVIDSPPGAMKVLALAAALFVALAAACGGGSASSGLGPRDVIAFGAREAGDDARYALHLVRPDGSDPHALVFEDAMISFPRWSPSGDRIAYVAGGDTAGLAGTLRIYDFATGAATTVSELVLAGPLRPAASWSRDGRRLAFIEAAAGGRLRVFDVELGKLLDIGAIPATAAEFSPSRDELAIVATNASTQESDLYLVDADGQDLRLLLERAGVEDGPRWSPKGDRLAFWSAPGVASTERELLVVERGGGDVTELGPGFGAAWSPDGDLLAYSLPAGAPAGANESVAVVPPDGGEPESLTQTVTLDRWPSWSPAGDRLAYAALVDRQTAFICLVQLEPLDQDCLELPRLVPAAPAWSPR